MRRANAFAVLARTVVIPLKGLNPCLYRSECVAAGEAQLDLPNFESRAHSLKILGPRLLPVFVPPATSKRLRVLWPTPLPTRAGCRSLCGNGTVFRERFLRSQTNG